MPLAEGIKNRRRINAFFEGIERAKRDFDRAPNGIKYAVFFAGIDRTVEEWQKGQQGRLRWWKNRLVREWTLLWKKEENRG